MRKGCIKVKLGEPFGQLRSIKEAKRAPDGMRRILCLCLACGTEKPIRLATLRNGHSRTCGCSKVKHRLSHEGMPEYTAWTHMMGRCLNPQHIVYYNYGGRGIKVCDRWHDFAAFLADVGKRPTPEHSLDRYPDNDGDYEPGNVRWATPKEQARNRRDTKMLTYKGETKSLCDFAEEYGIKRITLTIRLRRGWTVKQALTTPVASRRVSRRRRVT
jgi:hypothetical protein